MYVIANYPDLPDKVREDVEFFRSLGLRNSCFQGLVERSGNMSINDIVRQSFVRPGEHVAWVSSDYSTLYVIFRGRDNIHLYKDDAKSTTTSPAPTGTDP